MQFHGIGDSTLKLAKAITKRTVGDEQVWLGLCGQLLEAFQYLPEEANILHNDLTANNILVTDTIVAGNLNLQIIVIDFRKATDVEEGRCYHHTELKNQNTPDGFL